ncbi:MAG: sulfur carrier protein ThiS [Phycisphaerae bacterium]|nr:sulfur carrier protein ThiS [Phycisphaerae bacterium]
MMKLMVNGQPTELPEGTTMRELVARFELVPEKVAIERNRRLVRAAQYDAVLADGDQIEIVTFVGGGA